MGQDHSFDIVSKVNLQELRNAIQQAQKEIGTRFDFQGTSASLQFEEAAGLVKTAGDHQAQLNSVIDVLQSKLAKRGVPINAFAWKPAEQLPSGGMKRSASLQQGLASDKAREIVALIKGLGLKVQPRIDGDAVRVSGRQLDDLQTVIQALKANDFGVPLQVENYR
ncbi:MAG: YajQ family cyclic di-GMP-binding protein [Candidatus Omnitrophica bacterium]|nr:YajQ family cyclic di-GMP-binding protein [Candidatus Omnitrophota bacterium]